MRAALVLNPRSRRGRVLGGTVRAELTRAGITIVDSASPGQIDAVVAAGGDGTLASVISRAMALRVPIGIVPLGTFNELARTLEVPIDVPGACALIAAGHTRAIDVARVNGFYYTNEASIGISSRIARLQRAADKQRFGFFAVAISTLQAVRYARPFRVDVAFDGRTERLRTIQLTVANSNRFGGVIDVADAAIDDGWLDLYAVESEGIWPILSAAGAILEHRRRSGPGLRSHRSREFHIDSRRPHRITADGEPAGTTPADFELLPRAVRIFAPAENSSGGPLTESY